jgi:hypothetical protein
LDKNDQFGCYWRQYLLELVVEPKIASALKDCSVFSAHRHPLHRLMAKVLDRHRGKVDETYLQYSKYRSAHRERAANLRDLTELRR